MPGGEKSNRRLKLGTRVPKLLSPLCLVVAPPQAPASEGIVPMLPVSSWRPCALSTREEALN